MDLISVMQWFVWRPDRILAVSFVLFMLYFGMCLLKGKRPSVRTRLLLVSAALWAVFAGWESYCASKHYDIRVDLLLIYPVLAVISIFGLSVSIGSLIMCLFKE